ncbi:MAG: TIGR04168 family protein, partial [Cyanobium sp.]
ATAGGGHPLSQAATAVVGPVEVEASARRIERAALAAEPAVPLVLLAHCGPTGLGSEARDPCGRDWKRQPCDWGDHDLALALERIRARRPVPLVVFGHMHHTLRRQQGERITFLRDRRGTAYLNAACVPRHGEDVHGRPLRHFSWIHLGQEGVERASHRWYGLGGELLYEELLWCAAPRQVLPSLRAEVLDFSPQSSSSIPSPPVLERC